MPRTLPGVIDVPGTGIVEFPQEMDDAAIYTALKKLAPPPADDPWAQYRTQTVDHDPFAAPQARPSLGLGDTWPARIAKSIWSGVTLPGQVYQDAQQPPPTQISDSDVSPLGVGRAIDFGALASPINPMVRAGDRAIPGAARATFPVKPPAPTADELNSAANAGFDAIRNSPVQIDPQSVGILAQSIESQLNQKGIFPEHAPTTFKVIERLQGAPENSTIGFPGLHAARMAFGKAGTTPGTQDALASSVATRALDKYIADIPTQDFVAGQSAAPATAQTFNDALSNYAAAMRSGRVTGAEDRADLNAAVANSGQNVGNAIRQRFRDIVVQPRQSRGFSDSELAAAEEIARGTPAANVTRGVGNYLGGGGGLGAFLSTAGGATAGGMAGGPIGVAVGAMAPAVGWGAKAISNNLTKNQVRILDELTRMRSPLYQSALKNAPMTQNSAFNRALMFRVPPLMVSSGQ